MKAKPAFFFLLSCALLAALEVQSARAKRPGSRADMDYAAVDAYVQSQVKAWRIPGAALAVINGSQVDHLAGLRTGRRRPPGHAADAL